jgi:cyanophycin synthetase
MKILEIKEMRGPNYWSIKKHNLIVMLLDLEELEERPTNTIPGFYERLKALMPSLHSHYCSEGVPGGFFYRVETGTWMGHVIEHIALEMQTLAGMSVGFGRTRQASKKGVYNVVFSYQNAKAGVYTAQAAVKLVQALIDDKPYDLQKDINHLNDIWERERFGPSTESIVQEAVKRNIPYYRLDNDSLVQFGYGKKQRRLQATIASTTSFLAVEIAGNKETTKNLLQDAEIPVPRGKIIHELEELEEMIEEIGYPFVLKPVDGNHGKGASTNITSHEAAVSAFQMAKQYSPAIICEKRIEGRDFRALVVNYKFVAAAMRTPAAVTGDGTHTIGQLIDEVNKDPRRGNDHEKVLTKIKIDKITMDILEKKGYTLDTILPNNLELHLKDTANISTGGTATDVTDLVDPANILLFERIARVIGLDICGIDVIASTLCSPLKENGGAVLEVNAAPGFRMHLQPSYGPARNVAKHVIDMLFPDDCDGRIPIIAITGTNGKTTTSRMISHVVKKAGYKVGYTTTDGIYIDNQLIMKGDCTGPYSSELVLKDPNVEFAVLECARGGLLRSGLGFSTCDVAVITNVAEDHLGLGGIDTIEKLARVKSVVAETASKDGYAVLNADDDLVYEMKEDVVAQVALFSMDENNPRIISHCRKGGLAMVYENGFITLIERRKRTRIEQVKNIPITFGGAADFNIANSLAAALALYVQHIDLDTIREGLKSFVPSAETTPGRMNVFKLKDFTFIVDYAHNPHGMKALGRFLKAMDASVKVGIVAGVGDRREQDIIAVGEEAARIFDEIIIRHDRDTRGRSEQEIKELLFDGINKVDPNKKVSVCPKEAEAIECAVSKAQPGSFIVLLSDDITGALKLLKNYKEKTYESEPSMHVQV